MQSNYIAEALASVINPAQVKYSGHSLGARSNIDKKDSLVLAHHDLTLKLLTWHPEAAEIKSLMTLLAHLEAIGKESMREHNRYEKALLSLFSG